MYFYKSIVLVKSEKQAVAELGQAQQSLANELSMQWFGYLITKMADSREGQK